MNRSIQPPTPKVRLTSGVASLLKGGTGATNALDAVINLGGVHIPSMNQPMYAGKLDPYAVVYKSHLPFFYVDTPTIFGEKILYVGQATTYRITNFDSRTYYAVEPSIGTYVRNDDVISYTAPLDPQFVTFRVNEKLFTVDVRLPWPLTPTLAGVTTGSNSSAVAQITSSPFVMVAGAATHVSSDWEVATDMSFGNVVASVYGSTTNKTFVTISNLALSTTYYVRVRYNTSIGTVSDWSDAYTVVTKSRYSPTSEQAKIVASDRVASDNFGRSVAVNADGTRVVVGAPNRDEFMTSNTGCAYVFVRSGTSWTQEAKLSQSGILSTNIYFGFSVAIDDNADRIVVGAYGATSARGAVFIYTRSGTSWALEVQLQATDASNDDRLGYCVACNQDCSWIVLGCPRNNSGSTRSGTAYTYRRDGTIWYQENKLIQSDPQNNDFFGWSVAMDQAGVRAIVGAYLEDPSGVTSGGSAYIYTRTGNVWTQEAKIIASDVASSGAACFGYSVAMDSDGMRVAVGSYNATVSGLTTAGAVYVFVRSGSSWTEEVKLTATDAAAGDQLGDSVSISGDGFKVVAGASLQDPAGVSNAGAAYLFGKIGASWSEQIKVLASDRQASDNFGISLSISRDAGILIVGSHNEDPSGTSNAGSCYIYA